ncbi:hypothetical protein PV08_03733 [Exophiala spinifera]|uniref:Uncharacterized protein n=1 Tax=Exophiala spinifera TaxID=91928 RepID=A0A0D2BD84_9EURO|nr:uncharacterized protein PV08_03733 [Exophiala spinifera]KIW16545.1 hypothetical protein PV08_03733 [Exophiala spinifera]
MRAGVHKFPSVVADEVQFINTTAEDMEVPLGFDALKIKAIRLPRLEVRTLPPSPVCVDRSLSTGNVSMLSRMISGDENSSDLHSLLLRMSLVDESLPTLAVRHSLTSLSLLHTHGQVAARSSRGKALSAIRRCITGRLTQPSEVLQVISASLLMELYEIYSHESSSNTWTGSFCGSKKLAKLSYEYDEAYEGDIALVLDWLFYHNVMYKFTMRHWGQRNSEQEDLAREPTIISKDLFSPKRHIVSQSSRLT